MTCSKKKHGINNVSMRGVQNVFMRHPCVLQGNKHAVNQNHLKQQFDFFLYCFSSLVLVMGMHTVCPLSLDLALDQSDHS